MIKNQLKDHLFARVSDAYQLHSIYRPIKWRAKDVLSDRRRGDNRKRYYTIAAWFTVSAALVFVLMFLSTTNFHVSAPAIDVPKTVLQSGSQAFSRGDFFKAQQIYRQAIQSGFGTSEVWLNYDRSLLMNTFQEIKTDPSLLAPSHSDRIEKSIEPMPAGSMPNSDDMSNEEWQQMRQEVYEWLGC